MSEQVTMDAPAVLAFSETEMVHERDAKLLEVGAYPDKGLTVTEADLDGIVSRFSADGAPIKVEHMDTPLDPLGRVQRRIHMLDFDRRTVRREPGHDAVKVRLGDGQALVRVSPDFQQLGVALMHHFRFRERQHCRRIH